VRAGKFPKTAKELAEKGTFGEASSSGRLKPNTSIFVIPTPNTAEESYSPQLRVLFEHVVCADGHSLTAPHLMLAMVQITRSQISQIPPPRSASE
jgi:hypothetical protein